MTMAGTPAGSTDRPDLQKLLDDIRSARSTSSSSTRSIVDGGRWRLRQTGRTVRCAWRLICLGHQQFNTTTSMGRLTLNVLLSFAPHSGNASQPFADAAIVADPASRGLTLCVATNEAKDRSTLSVSRPIEVVVLNCW